MSKYPSGEGKAKSKKLSIGRNRSPKSVEERPHYGAQYMNENIPEKCRKKLSELFLQIEKEFEKVYVENQSRKYGRKRNSFPLS